MKQKLSVSIESNLIQELDVLVRTGKFRNKSHVVEYTLNKFMEEENGKQENN